MTNASPRCGISSMNCYENIFCTTPPSAFGKCHSPSFTIKRIIFRRRSERRNVLLLTEEVSLELLQSMLCAIFRCAIFNRAARQRSRCQKSHVFYIPLARAAQRKALYKQTVRLPTILSRANSGKRARPYSLLFFPHLFLKCP